MKMHRTFFAVVLLFFATVVFPVAAQPATVATAPLYKPDYTHQNDPLPAGVLAWDGTQKNTDVIMGTDFARFVFAFTNVAAETKIGLATNISYVTNFTTVTNRGFWHVLTGRKYTTTTGGITTNTSITAVTNSTPVPVTILNVHPSCGCTTAELPPVPWMLPPGTNSIIRVSVNLAGKNGSLFKTVNVATDKGRMDLMLRINILPRPAMTEAERAQGIAAAKLDRQAVFKGDCVSCHAKDVEGKYGQQLYAQVCTVCHEANPRASMVPDLHNLKDPTSEEFWRAWITSGKAGTLMPAFATSQGGPLNDLQIASLATYLSQAIPPHPLQQITLPHPQQAEAK
jgi:mono/diheme cytochrome c family protein